MDALVGYGQRGAPNAGICDQIRFTAGHRVLSLDVPSGLELTTGHVHEPAISAEATITVAAPKVGMRGPGAAVVGRLFLADISVPPAVWAALGLIPPRVFGRAPIVQVGRT